MKAERTNKDRENWVKVSCKLSQSQLKTELKSAENLIVECERRITWIQLITEIVLIKTEIEGESWEHVNEVN